jgi:hypothetical protein
MQPRVSFVDAPAGSRRPPLVDERQRTEPQPCPQSTDYGHPQGECP